MNLGLNSTLSWPHHLQSIWQQRPMKYLSTREGFVAYQRYGQTLVLAGEPCSKNADFPLVADQETLWNEVKTYAQDNDVRLCGYYCSQASAKKSGLKSIQVGVTRSLNLQDWNLVGRSGENVRRAVNFAGRHNYCFMEIKDSEKQKWKPSITHCEEQWTKPWPYKIRFLLGRASENFLASEGRWFVITQGEELLALASIYSYSEGYYVDQMMKAPGARLSMDALVSHLILKLKEEKVQTLNFGLCPARIQSPKSFWERVVRQLYAGFPGYSPKGLYNFKKKYSNVEQPQYLLIDPKGSLLTQCYSMFRVTFRL